MILEEAGNVETSGLMQNYLEKIVQERKAKQGTIFSMINEDDFFWIDREWNIHLFGEMDPSYIKSVLEMLERMNYSNKVNPFTVPSALKKRYRQVQHTHPELFL